MDYSILFYGHLKSGAAAKGLPATDPDRRHVSSCTERGRRASSG